jgi:hypothetical protein
MADEFERQLFRAMRAVARDAGHPSAYPATKAGQLATTGCTMDPLHKKAPIGN